MKGLVPAEYEVHAPANEVWGIIGGLKFGEIGNKLVPHIVQKAEVIEGDGGVNTILKVSFVPGAHQASFQTEKFTTVDNKNRIKVIDVIEGGYLSMGFTVYRIHFEIVEKDANSSIIKSAIEYELEEEFVANASFVSNKKLLAIFEAIEKYLIVKHSTEST